VTLNYRLDMCGNHRDDGSPVDHHHGLPIFLPAVRGPRRWRRRAFLGEFGKGTVAFAVLAPTFIAACGTDGEDAAPSTTTTAGTPTDPTVTNPPPTTSSPDDLEPPDNPEPTGDGPGNPAPAPLTWARANLGFVSAYVLARGTEVAIVDTGVAGSADDIGQTLAGIGLDYGNVDHVFLTHLHPDHAGSIMEVMAQASNATAYAGPDDIGGIDFDPITAAADGDDIFGLEVVATPGHTSGHISVIDHEAGILVAGDALNTAGGGVQGPNPDFSIDITMANQSAKRLAELSFNTLLAGHGDPVEDMADTAVAALAATL
jgi:glyoxylase-like metal-dependent hydrolase (beta-lactamase superfamily II)